MISIGDVIAVGTLCMNIYNRCKCSRGEFKLLSIKAFNLYASLKIVADGWRAHNLSEEYRAQLQGLVMSISELLRELESRLLEYGSLGRETPGRIYDQIGWAWKGGGTDFEKRLDTHISLMILFLNSVNFARPNQGEGNELEPPQPWSNGANVIIGYNHQQNLITPMPANTAQTLVGPPSTKVDNYTFGSHSFWDGVRFLAFFILTMLCVAIMFVIAGFFIAGLVLFPIAEIPTGFARSPSHWHRFTAFFGLLFNKVFRFVNGLWD